ncbi:YifB family Mg chelatase-like AAA ATPase [Variovorax sp. VaC1]|uniref:YifB family Mg chelatase-like AAA ATPase n=1 Tax=Variovorax sp. VaC1 TaxID=3373132 RepID=UPI003749DF36
MSLSLVQSRALLGLEAASVTVEVHLANGLPSFTLVGLAETEVKEARERVRSAIQNAGLEFPNNKKIVVNLAPADLPKDSGRFDLPIALGILAASGQIDNARLAGHEFAGELSLSGDLRPVRGTLAMALALHVRGVATRLVLPMDSAQEAALVPSGEVYGARHLLDVVRQFIADADAAAQLPDAPGDGWARVQAASGVAAPAYADLADVKGHTGAKRALEIAAAGGHSLLMVGEPGSGKSMLAQRFAGLLPPMSIDEALESAAVASLGGRFATEKWMCRPTAAPHHTASAVALVGGGVDSTYKCDSPSMNATRRRSVNAVEKCEKKRKVLFVHVEQDLLMTPACLAPSPPQSGSCAISAPFGDERRRRQPRSLWQRLRRKGPRNVIVGTAADRRTLLAIPAAVAPSIVDNLVENRCINWRTRIPKANFLRQHRRTDEDKTG